MLTLLALLGVVVVLFLGAALATREDAQLVPVQVDAADLELPDGPLGAPELRSVRFGLALRGYRMREVDALLDRLAAQLEALAPPAVATDRSEHAPGDAAGPEPAGGPVTGPADGALGAGRPVSAEPRRDALPEPVDPPLRPQEHSDMHSDTHSGTSA